MNIYPKKGIDKVLFGMKTKTVENILGKPDKQFTDEDQNTIYLYNNAKLSLTFYEEEDLRLGYMTVSHAEATLFEKLIIGMHVADAKKSITTIQKWEIEDFDLTENHFNESNWFTLQVEFGTIIRIEIGAVFNENDEMQFKFKNNKSIK